MKIVILDGYTLNPGDLDWSDVTTLGDVTIYDRTAPGQLLERCAGAEAILTNKVPIRKEVINQLPQLKYIGVLATGYNVVDTPAAVLRGITVTNVPGYGTDSVAQFTFALLLELCHHVQPHSDSVRQGKWADSKDFSYHDHPLIELAGKTIGIIGMGTIGKKVALMAEAFGMNCIGHSRRMTGTLPYTDFKWESIPSLLEQADVVSLHCPLLPETTGLMGRENLAYMKPTAFLLNTSRGPLINDHDLADALNKGQLAGAGLDVLSVEPPDAGNPLFSAKNCLITPHIAWATKEARGRLLQSVAGNLTAFISGKPMNVVN